jgi:hypothetical protein
VAINEKEDTKLFIEAALEAVNATPVNNYEGTAGAALLVSISKLNTLHTNDTNSTHFHTASGE